MNYVCIPLLIFIIYSTGSYLNGHIQNMAYGGAVDSIFSVKDNPYNQTFANWTGKWFNWFLALPNIEGNKSLSHPRDHYSPEKCSWNQDKNGPVWMLADGPDINDLSQTDIRDCKVPAGKALLVQIVGSNCSPVEGYKTDQDLLNCAAWILDKAAISASIDGKDVIDTNKDPNDKSMIYVKPFILNLTYGKNNYYGDPEGTQRGMGAGYFLFLKPLPVGRHTITFAESVINPSDSNDRRISHVQYNIAVENMTK